MLNEAAKAAFVHFGLTLTQRITRGGDGANALTDTE